MNQNIRYTLLNYAPEIFEKEAVINPYRIYNFNKKPVRNGRVVYLMERELRIKDNFGLLYAIQKSKEINTNIKIICAELKAESIIKKQFYENQIRELKSNFINYGFDFDILTDREILSFLNNENIALLVIDFNPISDREHLKKLPYKIEEADGHNIISARYLSSKAEYNASTIRRKIYYKIYPFLTEFNNFTDIKTEADIKLQNFIENKLPYYAELKNDPVKDMASGLSKYLNLGFLSSQRTAIEIIKSKTENINKEVFLEELIIRKELADNFCLYCRNYKTFEGIPNWAKQSINEHRYDLRGHIYNLKEFEYRKTHDVLWNAVQNQLLKEGRIHGYLRMYWAKKIFEWSENPETALDTAIYLNDKYALDSPSPNGYVGILWTMGALHDRPFMEAFVTGKIRRMSAKSIYKKFDIEKYLNKYL